MAGQAASTLQKGSVQLALMDRIVNGETVDIADVLRVFGSGIAGAPASEPPGISSMAQLSRIAGAVPLGNNLPEPPPPPPRRVPVPQQRAEAPAPRAPKPKAPLEKVLNKNGARLFAALGQMIPGCGLSVTLYPDADADGAVYHVAVIIPPENGEGAELLSEVRSGPDFLGDAILESFAQAIRRINASIDAQQP